MWGTFESSVKIFSNSDKTKNVLIDWKKFAKFVSPAKAAHDFKIDCESVKIYKHHQKVALENVITIWQQISTQIDVCVT